MRIRSVTLYYERIYPQNDVMMNRQSIPKPSSTRSIVPALWSSRGYRSAVLNVFAFGLVALLAMWLVHQTEYAIEYRARFGSVMAATPHHLYMAQVGFFLVLLAGMLGACICTILIRSRRAIAHLLPLVPNRLLRHALLPLEAVPARVVFRTAAGLALFQVTLYIIQENLESVAMGAGVPALGVLFAPQHITVVPLHLVAALGASLLLWLLSTLLHHTHTTLRVTRFLARIGASRRPATRVGPPASVRLPTTGLLAARRSLRSPPQLA